jgi:hypothetical protein
MDRIQWHVWQEQQCLKTMAKQGNPPDQYSGEIVQN